jgi:choline dehydrogenase-like flavoprotein
MFLDFRKPDVTKEIEADICIVGAGAAGIALAHSFLGSRISVCLLESGGFEPDEAIQSLYGGEDVGVLGSLAGTRLRYFGGTTAVWQGYCLPYSESVFQGRAWVPNSAWPIQKTDLDPYYEIAHKLCQIGPYRYDLEVYAPENRTFPAFHPGKLTTRFWQVSPPTHFGTTYRDELEKAENISVYLYANLTELEANDSASVVRAAKIQLLDGTKGIVRARYYILACGGIENARILLLSNGVQSEGLGNSSDLVGRYFMQHPWVIPGVILADNPELVPHIFSRFKMGDLGVYAFPGICPTLKAQAQKQMLNHVNVVRDLRSHDTGYYALLGVWHDLKSGEWPDELSEKLWTVITDLDSVTSGLYSRARDKRYQPPITGSILFSQVEHAPYPDSRITLSDERDPLGLRKVKVDWRLSELEKRTVRQCCHFLGEEFGRLNLGRIKLADWLTADDHSWPEPMWGGGHHMGTTRMSNDPAQGVVDRDCRMHAVENLYIASSSVFPSCGYENPTLTIVALAVRLAEHLKGRLTG